MSPSGRLALRAAVVAALALVTMASPAVVQGLAGASRPSPRLATLPMEPMALDVAGQNAMAQDPQMAAMARTAEANGLVPAPGNDLCGHEYEFHTVMGLQCSMAPMLKDMFTSHELAAAQMGPATAATASKITCIGDGNSGKRIELVYARRTSTPDRFASVATTEQGWAAAIEQTMVLSAQKTGGIRKVRWVHDSSCTAVVLDEVVPDTVASFAGLVGALQQKGLTSTSRKYLVAWDDAQTAGAFCGLGQLMPDSSPGLNNESETQPTGALFAAVQPVCWTPSVAAHEVMHTLGAVQNDAPNASGYGHCTDESDIMCYVDHAGVVMRQVCPLSQEALYDCNNNDYFNTNPPAGSYLKTHWDPANSGFLDQSGSTGPPTSPQNPTIAAGSGQVTVSWTAPAYNGGSTVLAYTVALDPGGRTVTVPASSTSVVITGLADGTPVTASIVADNRSGTGTAALTNSVTPAPVVITTARSAVGDSYLDMARGPSGSEYLAATNEIDKVDANGVKTVVVTGVPGDPQPENSLPLSTPVSPQSLAVSKSGDLIWFDQASNRIRRLSAGHVNTIAGTGDFGDTGDGGPALAATLQGGPLAVNLNDDSIYLVDESSGVVRRFTSGGTINKVAGVAGAHTFGGDGGPATAADFFFPSDIAIDATGNIYIADTDNHRIRRFTVGGTITTVAGDGTTFLYPGSPLVATSTGVSYPSAIDWSPDKGLIIDSFGLERILSGTNLVRLAGDLFDSSASDADGTPAPVIYYSKLDTVVAVTWSGSTLQVLTNGPNPTQTASEGKLRSAGPWHAAAAATAPAAPVVAPVATSGLDSAGVAWVPASNDGAALTSYRVTASPGGSITTASGSSTSVVVTNLTPGTSYTFTVAAVNAKGTGPASVASNAVIPTAPPSYLPFASWSALVARQYNDLVHRAPTSAESSSWVSQLSGGTATKGDLDDSLRRSSENLTNVDPVVRLYRAFLGRAPDAGGLQFWIARKRNVPPATTWSVTQIAESFTASSEFKTKYGSMSNLQFVTQIYTDVLGRAADPSGVTFWTAQLDSKAKDRAQVVLGFSESNEYKTKQAQNTDVAIAYIYLLGRSPTTAEATDWTTREKAATTDSALLTELLDSAGYAGHIGSP